MPHAVSWQLTEVRRAIALLVVGGNQAVASLPFSLIPFSFSLRYPLTLRTGWHLLTRRAHCALTDCCWTPFSSVALWVSVSLCLCALSVRDMGPIVWGVLRVE